MTVHELHPDGATLVRHLADLQARINELNGQAESVKAELRHLTTGDYTINGRPALRIAATRRFNPTAGLALVPEELRPLCVSEAIDAAKVRQYLAPALVETCMVDVGAPRITVL